MFRRAANKSMRALIRGHLIMTNVHPSLIIKKIHPIKLWKKKDEKSRFGF